MWPLNQVTSLLVLSYYIKNLLTSLEGKHRIDCGDKQTFVPLLVFCPWFSVSRVESVQRYGGCRTDGGFVIVVPLCCCDPSVAIELQLVSLHDTWQAQAMHAQNTHGQILMGCVANR